MSYIFLDESGDLGFSDKKKNSKFFVITVLSIKNKRPIENVVKKIHSSLRKKVKKIGGGVLHAYKEKSSTKERLLKGLSMKDLSIMSIYLNKSKVYTHLQEEKHLLYNYVANILLDRIIRKKLIVNDSKIYLIASKRETNKFLNDNFKSYLENQLKGKHKLTLEVLIKTPFEEKGLQAVDFISWAIYRKYEHGDDLFYNIVKSKIVEENALFH